MDSLVSRHITIKSPAEQEKMRVAGRLAAEVLDMIGEHVKPGVTTEELDRLCFEHITEVQKSIPANVNYRGFPKTICSSVNHVVCHGIPNEKVAEVRRHPEHRRHGHPRRFSRRHQPHVLRRQTHAARAASHRTCWEAMWRGIEKVKPGARLGDIGHAIQTFVEERQLLGRARILRPRHRPRVPRGSAGAALRRARHRRRAQGRHDLHDRAHGQRRQAARAVVRRRLDRRHQGPLAVGAVGTHGAWSPKPASKC